MKLNQSQIKKSMVILSKLEDNNNIYSMDEKAIMALMEKYELLNKDFLEDLEMV